MSFIKTDNTARVFAPGYFLAADAENCTRETREMKQTDATTLSDGTKIVKMGTAYPANDATAEGIVYEDIDVTSGNMPGSVVTKGIVYEDRLADTLAEGAKTALESKGFTFVETAPTVTRPYN
jgi:hypothetical protein